MNKYELATGLVDLEELSIESEEINENGAATPATPAISYFVTGAIASALISAALPTTACSSQC
ncbi:class II lanthipeptide, LchA2/BrtA2 family [uncultured Clostridium sp.]|uniref:class II lanthipeptide, LchA2/BrtA2 family n=1 Tax=uncultured Clostridium sp. TaxID=59620 RepID=UPI0025CF4DF5|nr:class II lanthipeptide, LchA2/BrtA2 family [uncultured Clostridium sp.]